MGNDGESQNPKSTDQWMAQVYEELRRIAAHRMKQENPGQTLQVTALVHEAYIRLRGSLEPELGGGGGAEGAMEKVDDSRTFSGPTAAIQTGGGPASQWKSRAHFFAAAAEAMRRILIDRARHKKTLKRGGGLVRVELDDPVQIDGDESLEQFLALDVALEKLEKSHPRKAQLVKLRYFAGLTIAEAADALDIARSTADADWAFAKSWLKLELS